VFATAAPRRDFPRLAALFFQALIAKVMPARTLTQRCGAPH